MYIIYGTRRYAFCKMFVFFKWKYKSIYLFIMLLFQNGHEMNKIRSKLYGYYQMYVCDGLVWLKQLVLV